MNYMQHGKKISHKKGNAGILCCMCMLCCLLCSSCISIPGENSLEDRNLAADYYEIALKYVDLKQYDKALTSLQKAREKTEDTVKIDYQIARTYALSNKWKEAATAFEILLELDPENCSLKEDYAYTLYKSGEKEKALQLYAELLEINKGDERLQKNYQKLYDEAYPPDPEAEKNPSTSEKDIDTSKSV